MIKDKTLQATLEGYVTRLSSLANDHGDPEIFKWAQEVHDILHSIA